ncbi:MAG: hypothetical protein ABW123_04205 [Cystobacter sp.]
MERVRPAPSSSDLEAVPSLSPLPDLSAPGDMARPLREQLNVLRAHGVTPGEVDLFVKQLEVPVAQQDARRFHADTLLSVLEDEQLSALVTTQGKRLGSAALESLKSLGYPYALEVTPAMLTRVQEHEPTPGATRRLWQGMSLALISALAIWSAYMPKHSSGIEGWLSALLLSPAVLTLLAHASDHSPAHRTFNVLHWLVGASCLIAAGLVPGLAFAAALAGSGLFALGSAWSLRHGPMALPPE